MSSQTKGVRKGSIRASKVQGLKDSVTGGIGSAPVTTSSVLGTLNGDVVADEAGGLGEVRVVGMLGRPLIDHDAVAMIGVPWLAGDDRATFFAGSADTDMDQIGIVGYSGSAFGVLGYAETSAGTGVVGQAQDGKAMMAQALAGGAATAFDAHTLGTGRVAVFHRNIDAATDAVVSIQQLSATNEEIALEVLQDGDSYGIFADVTLVTNPFPAIQGITDGTGPGTAGRSNSSGAGVYGSNYGDGPGGYFFIDDAANTSFACGSLTNGVGNAALFEVDNGSNSQASIGGLHNGSGPSVYGLNTGTGESLRGDATDAGTDDIRTVASLRRHSTGTPDVGFGLALNFLLESDGANDILVAQIENSWTDPTNATRVVRSRYLVYDKDGDAQQGLTIEVDNATPFPRVGLFDAAPIVKPTMAGATAGATYGPTEQLMLQTVYTAFKSLVGA